MNFTQPDRTGEPADTSVTAGGPVTPLSTDEPSAYRIFFGQDGLRAIWGILLFLALREALRYVVYPIFLTLVPVSSVRSGGIPLRTMLVFEGAGLLCVALATWLMAKIEHRPVSAYGFSRNHALRNLCAGLVCGAVLISLLILLLRAAGLLVFDARLLHGSSILRDGLLWLVGFLLVGLLEELFSRGYLQFTLTRGLSGIYTYLFGPAHANAFGFWTAALILSFAFGIGHRANPGESPLGLVAAGFAGLLFCFSLWRTGSLWWAIGFHTAWDWAQSFLYGVADSGLMVNGHLFATHPVGDPWLSGGLTGPEGSLFLIPILIAGAVVILLTLPRTHFGYTPASSLPPALD